MENQSVTCPDCGQEIKNASATQGIFRCGACGTKFPAPGKRDAPPATQSLDLKEPSPAGYGLLLIAAWATVLLSAGLWLWFWLVSERAPNFGPLAALTQAKNWLLLGYGTYVILLALLAVAAVSALTRLDYAAAWLAWRSGVLKDSVQTPRHSNLPYVLPLAVTGGLWVMVGLASGMETSVPDDWGQLFAGGIFSAALGAIVLLTGLGFGEIRRFLARMTAYGKAQTDRNADDALGLNVRVQPNVPARSAAVGLLRAALCVLLIIYLAVLVRVSLSSGLPDSRQALVALATVGFVAVVGGTYSLLRLSRLWAEMLHQWNLAARRLAGPAPQRVGGVRTALFKYLGWAVGGIIVAGEIIVLLYASPLLKFRSQIEWYWLLDAIPGVLTPILCALLVWWLAALKNDALQFAGSTALFDQSGQVRAPLSVRVLTTLAVLCALVQLVAVGSVLTLALLADLAAGGTLKHCVAIMLPFALVVALVIYPLLSWSLLVLDLSQAAENLRACVEQTRVGVDQVPR